MNILTSYHPAIFALQSLHEQFPGALDFYVFHYSDGVKAVHTKGKNKQLFVPNDITQSDLKPKIQQFRRQKKEVIWGDIDDLPAQNGKQRSIKQLSIQDEIEQHVLIFRVASLTDDAFDVFAISFSKTFSNFYIPSGRNVLSSELKASIGKTIRNQITWLYQLHAAQNQNISRIQDAYRQNADELEKKEEELQKEKSASRSLLEKYLNQLVLEQEIALNTRIVLKAGFLDKIKSSEIPIESIKQLIVEASVTAYDLAFEKSTIELTPNLIQAKKNQTIDTGRTHKLIELDKTATLLDRYESAARQLQEKSLRINGKNLASELSISAPAITDAIKKHQSKIRRLLEKYPSKWPLVCDFIKPIREIKWKVESA